MSRKLTRDAASTGAFSTAAFGDAHPAGNKGAAFCLGRGMKSLSEYGFDEEVGNGEGSLTDATLARATGVAHGGDFNAGADPGGSCKGTLFLDLLVELLVAFRDSSSMISFKLLKAGDGIVKVSGRDFLVAMLLGFRDSSSIISRNPFDDGVFTFTKDGLATVSGRG